MNTAIPPVIKRLLARLNFHDDEEIQAFLYPRLDKLPHPLQMKGVAGAVKIILEGLEQGTDIIVWGDYDVDGTTGTALLVNFFRELGVEAHWHIPNRLKDGYGLHSDTFTDLHTNLNCQDFILITVDCGISNFREVADIIALGGKVIVTDHHQLPIGDLPDCIIINPNQDGCGFRQDKLAGVGVAFYLAAAIRSALEEAQYFKGVTRPNMKEYLGFVALGTISDMVEITQTNRILVRAGMEALSRSQIAGLSSMIENAGLKGGPITSEDVSFSLGPRINAAGRLGAAETAVELMTCDNTSAGSQLSKKLDFHNERRKILCEQNLESALSIIGNKPLEGISAIIVTGEFHPGIIGIVASKIVDIHGKPTIVFARETGPDGSAVLKGSGRSVPGIDLLKCLHECSADIEKYGGHAMAAGLTVVTEKLQSFSRALERHVALEQLNCAHLQKRSDAVVECDVDEIMSRDALDYLLKFEPFGPENERPVFRDKNASIVNCRAIGSLGQHLQLTIRGKYANYRGVGFGLGARYDEVRRNPDRSILFTPMINRYRGTTEWQLQITDI